jgi:hypothetical protein
MKMATGMKWCSKLVQGEIKIKATMRYYLCSSNHYGGYYQR